MRFVDHVVYVRMKLRLDGGPRLEDPHTAVNEAAALVAFYSHSDTSQSVAPHSRVIRQMASLLC